MRSSKAFNSRQTREIQHFAVIHQDGGAISLNLAAPRERPGRRSFDRFVIEMDEAEAKRLYLILGRKFATNPLVAQGMQSFCQGVGMAVGKSLLESSREPQ